MFSALCLAMPLSLAALVAISPMQVAIRNSQPFYVPFYDAIANGHTSPAGTRSRSRPIPGPRRLLAVTSTTTISLNNATPW